MSLDVRLNACPGSTRLRRLGFPGRGAVQRLRRGRDGRRGVRRQRLRVLVRDRHLRRDPGQGEFQHLPGDQTALCRDLRGHKRAAVPLSHKIQALTAGTTYYTANAANNLAGEGPKTR